MNNELQHVTKLVNGVPPHVIPYLEKAGWKFSGTAQAWRKYADNGELFSPHPADHDRAFPDALLSATKRADAAQEPDNQKSDQVANHDTTIHPSNNATPGDTGLEDPEYKTD